MIAATDDLGGNLSRAKLSDRPPVQVESAGNGAQAPALSEQRVDLGMPLLTASSTCWRIPRLTLWSTGSATMSMPM